MLEIMVEFNIGAYEAEFFFSPSKTPMTNI